ncbi:MAG: ComEC/Rec2 family competence protein [Bryobacteraceae bacterium]
MPEDLRFAGYPTAAVFEKPSKARDSKALKQLLWGDWIKITGPKQGDFFPVQVRGVKGFVASADMQKERLLELIFVDIGQGDGCLLITPDDKIVIIDAGAGDNMARFLRWRFRGFFRRIDFEAAIFSHSDLDHYGGFADLFDQENLFFKNIYTNGLMERAAAKDTEILGKPKPNAGEKYITDLVPDLTSLKSFFADPATFKGKKYPTMLKKALDSGKFTNFKMLSVEDKFVPGFSATDGDVVMELLGPVPETVSAAPALRWLGDVGKTKNGHSVVVRIRYGDVTIFAGGDLNIPSESLLLAHHAGAAAIPATEAERLSLAEAARPKLSADFAKACHHGSADVSRAFLTAIHPMATVISSGDNEAFSHPRADTLGTIGKCSRGDRPAIFSTELARSAPERIKHPQELHAELDKVIASLQTSLSAAERKKVDASIQRLKKNLERSVVTYGAINLRTDGHRAVIAQKIEKPRGKKTEWDVYRFEKDAATGELAFFSKHEDE